jgi:hypothetical protein
LDGYNKKKYNGTNNKQRYKKQTKHSRYITVSIVLIILKNVKKEIKGKVVLVRGRGGP